MSENQSFWSTMPGILTGIATVITAIGGLVVVLSQTGFLGDNNNKEKEVERKELVVEKGESIGMQPPKEAGTTLKDSKTRIADNLASSKTNSGAERINLLSSENGGQILVATSDVWRETIDGKDYGFSVPGSGRGEAEAVYAFKDAQAAVFDTFTVLIQHKFIYNLKDFELLWGNESATGKFYPIGKFQTKNMKLFKTPYQEFKFPPVTAKYLKVRLLSSWEDGKVAIQVHEFQLWGTLQ